MGLLTIYNGAMPTTAALVPVATGTTIKTHVQLKTFNICDIVEWGINCDVPASISTIKCELLDTGTVFGTVTAYADADIFKTDSVEQAVASVQGLTLSTSASGYTCTSEGSITSVRMFDAQFLTPSANGGQQFIHQFPLGERPRCIIGNAVRIRVTATVSCNVYAYVQVRF